MSKSRRRAPRSEHYLSVVAIFKNEAPHLDEWLAFGRLQGVEHFLLYDHSSTDNSREVLQPWIDAGLVEVLDWPVQWKHRAQTKAYLDALRRLRGRSRWVAFIDLDEFLFSPAGESLPKLLERYEGKAGVVVNWQCYGTSGHKSRPAGLTIESYTHRARTSWIRNRRVKCIVDPLLAIEAHGPHLFRVQPGHTLVTEDMNPVTFEPTTKWRRKLRYLAAWFPYLPLDPYARTVLSTKAVSIRDLRINHYVTRSREDLSLKYKDRNMVQAVDRKVYSRYHDRNEVADAILVPHAGAVREIIATVRAGWTASRAVNG